ncbi:hypothetical protein FBU30_001620 [Linnemannia zychae]|nr:hypothetical protein FBU30_001620 [Linnemannia zychae]
MTSGPSANSAASKKTPTEQPQPISIPLQNTSAATEPSILTSSSPIYSRPHPFLRKFQATAQMAQQQQNQGILSSAFSTSATSFSSSGINSDNEVDQKIAAAAAGDKSPTLAAAKATDAVIQKRLNLAHHGHSKDETSHSHACGCSPNYDSDDDTAVNPSYLPPISDEALEFSMKLLGQNKAWAIKTEQDRPGFFAKLEKQQKPEVLWIGCSDSRVPANQIVNMDPGEIFVHRNIANVVTHTDMNLLSVLEYAVDVLKVRHIIVCGHYGCGGVAASLTQKQFGVIDNWLRNIKDLYTIHRKKFDALPQGGKEQQDLLTELNVIQSALNVSHTSIIQKAWARGEKLSVHGWCYRLSDGVIRNLGLCIEGPGNVEEVYRVMDEHKASK